MNLFKTNSTAACVYAVSGAVLLAAPGLALADFKLTSGTNELTISGNINAQFDHISTSGATVAANQPPSRARLNQNSSELRFTGTRDLGNGFQGFATIGSEVQSFAGSQGNNLNTFAFRNTGVGLRGNFGEVALGRWDTHYHFNVIAGIDSSYVTGPLAGKLQISISSSLFGVLKNTSSDPRGDLCRFTSSRPSTSL